jgi:hypothetical protein
MKGPCRQSVVLAMVVVFGPGAPRAQTSTPGPSAVPSPATVVLAIRTTGTTVATVSIDDQPARALPYEGPVTPGPHRFVVEGPAAGLPPFDLDVPNVPRLEVVVEPESLDVPVVITADGADTAVWIAGRDTGARGRFSGKLRPGLYDVEQRRPDGVSSRAPLVVSLGAPRAVVLPALPVPVVPADPPATPTAAPSTEPQEAAPADTPASEPPAPGPEAPPDEGFYGGLGPSLGAPLAGQVRIDCGDATKCVKDAPVAYGGVLLGGYHFGLMALEFQFAADYGTETRTRRFGRPGGPTEVASDSGVGRLETFEYSTATAFAGLGPRLVLGSGVARFTTALSLGILYRWQALDRTLTEGVTDAFVRNFNIIGPGGRFEIGGLFGRPGVASGVVSAWLRVDAPTSDARVEAKPNDQVSTTLDAVLPIYRTPAYTLSSGVQMAAGISLGAVFGL